MKAERSLCLSSKTCCISFTGNYWKHSGLHLGFIEFCLIWWEIGQPPSEPRSIRRIYTPGPTKKKLLLGTQARTALKYIGRVHSPNHINKSIYSKIVLVLCLCCWSDCHTLLCWLESLDTLGKYIDLLEFKTIFMDALWLWTLRFRREIKALVWDL